MDIEMMRNVIGRVYPGDSWRDKVSKMSDEQVTAIYLKFVKQSKIAAVMPNDFTIPYIEEFIRLCEQTDAIKQAGYEEGDELIFPRGGLNGPIIIKKGTS